MTTVEQAEKLILAQLKDYGDETLPFELALDKVLAEPILADRDLPPFNRVTMDGIAVSYDALQNGTNTFRIKATQAAGDEPVDIDEPAECIEIMTGAVLPFSVDTVIRCEDVEIRAGAASVHVQAIKKGQNIHPVALIKSRVTCLRQQVKRLRRLLSVWQHQQAKRICWLKNCRVW